MSSRTRARSLDDLTEDILIHILTFLPTLDAVHTSLLSRKWRNQKLWRALPSLNFIENPMDDCILLAEFIDQTIKNRSGFPIQKFRLSCDSCFCDKFCDAIVPKLDNWISYALSHKAEELNIELLLDDCECVFNFSLLNNTCVRDVKFYGGQLRIGLPSMKLDSIRSLYLGVIRLTDDMVADLTSWCNNLESLVLFSCRGMKRLRICSSSLKKLSLKYGRGSSLEICCPNLCSLVISKFEMNKYCIKASASLEAEVNTLSNRHNKWWSNVLRELKSVKRLATHNYWFQHLSEEELAACFDGCVFENLNHLELETGWENFDLFGIAALLKICPNITTLTLYFPWFSWSYDEVVGKPIEFNIPNLKILNLKNSKGKEIKGLVELMKKHGTALEKIVVWDQNGKRSSIPLQGSS